MNLFMFKEAKSEAEIITEESFFTLNTSIHSSWYLPGDSGSFLSALATMEDKTGSDTTGDFDSLKRRRKIKRQDE